MVLIISQSKFDASTEIVIDWLSHLGIPFYRLNGIDFLKEISIEISSSGCNIYLRDICWDQINIIWFRRWINIDDFERLLLNGKNNEIGYRLSLQFNEILRSETRSLVKFFFETLPKSKLFCRLEIDEINKLSVLKKAQELKICIPNTYVLTKRSVLENLKYQNELITKSIDNANSITFNGKKFLGYTALVDNLTAHLPTSFAPSLFQHLIKKKFEIRSFFLNSKFYSMAIFSQADEQTKIDFRKYNYKNPNRVAPYNLPEELEKKLNNLASFFNLNACSFDLIMSEENEIVFLEVNPSGQFGMISYPCNYFLEREIAKELKGVA